MRRGLEYFSPSLIKAQVPNLWNVKRQSEAVHQKNIGEVEQ